VVTDEGLIGLGETFDAEAVAAYIHESAAPYLLGKDPLRIDEHSPCPALDLVGFSGSGAGDAGLSAIDIALGISSARRPASRSINCWAASAMTGSAPTTPAPATAASEAG
jgi:hypothetical protein